MEPVTLIATDLDGTFLNSKKQVSDLNREAVSKLKNHGILFGIASGRPVETVRAMLKKWRIEDRGWRMNFKLNLMLIPFTVPRTAFNYLPSCDTIILNFPFRLAKSRLRRLFAGRPLRWVSPF